MVQNHDPHGVFWFRRARWGTSKIPAGPMSPRKPPTPEEGTGWHTPTNPVPSPDPWVRSGWQSPVEIESKFDGFPKLEVYLGHIKILRSWSRGIVKSMTASLCMVCVRGDDTRSHWSLMSMPTMPFHFPSKTESNECRTELWILNTNLPERGCRFSSYLLELQHCRRWEASASVKSWEHSHAPKSWGCLEKILNLQWYFHPHRIQCGTPQGTERWPREVPLLPNPSFAARSYRKELN